MEEEVAEEHYSLVFDKDEYVPVAMRGSAVLEPHGVRGKMKGISVGKGFGRRLYQEGMVLDRSEAGLEELPCRIAGGNELLNILAVKKRGLGRNVGDGPSSRPGGTQQRLQSGERLVVGEDRGFAGNNRISGDVVGVIVRIDQEFEAALQSVCARPKRTGAPGARSVARRSPKSRPESRSRRRWNRQPHRSRRRLPRPPAGARIPRSSLCRVPSDHDGT